MTEPARRGRGRPSIPPEEQRRRLLDAAERCFDRARYESITVHDIVSEAGMSSRSFYERFASKEQLAIELAIDRGDEFIAHLETVLRESETLLEAVDRSLARFLSDPPVVILDVERMSGSLSDRAREVRDVYRSKIGDVLMGNIAAVVAADLVAAEVAPDPMSLLLVLSGIEGFVVRYNAEGRRKELRALHPQLMVALKALFPKLVSHEIRIPK